MENPVKTLGILFYPDQDVFGYKIDTPKAINYTKRGLLSITASLFDPVGWCCPFIMSLRILLQDLWLRGLNWDQYIGDEAKEAFNKCLNELKSLNNLKIPRWIGTSAGDTLELIGFSDLQNSAHLREGARHAAQDEKESRLEVMHNTKI